MAVKDKPTKLQAKNLYFAFHEYLSALLLNSSIWQMNRLCSF